MENLPVTLCSLKKARTERFIRLRRGGSDQSETTPMSLQWPWRVIHNEKSGWELVLRSGHLKELKAMLSRTLPSMTVWSAVRQLPPDHHSCRHAGVKTGGQGQTYW